MGVLLFDDSAVKISVNVSIRVIATCCSEAFKRYGKERMKYVSNKDKDEKASGGDDGDKNDNSVLFWKIKTILE